MNLPAFYIALGLLCCLPAAAHAESCQTADCHAATANYAYPHPPVADGDCLGCHEQTQAEHPAKAGSSFRLVEKDAALCFQCHDAMGKKRVVHDPVREGDCLACHNPHGSANRFLLSVGTDRTGLCFECHDSEPFLQRSVHGPAAVGACTECHSPHESVNRSLLLSPVRDLCLACHEDFAEQMQAASVIHPPVSTSPCTDCHDPHAAAADFMLKQKMPDLCFECHPQVGDLLAKARVQHAPMNDPGSCGNCHSTHFSGARGLLASDEKTLCLGCHGSDNLGTPPLQNIRKQLMDKPVVQISGGKRITLPAEEKPYQHGPLQEGRCGGCHDPHGSDHFRILSGSYPQGMYAPYQEKTYEFCLNCHDRGLLRFEETTIYTGFRNGNRNLHFVHVNDRRKGRTCRLCHEPHASSGDKLINLEGTPFGDWQIPIRYQATANGGSCAPGCHRSLAYDRESPAEN